MAITRGPAPVAEYLEEMILDLIVHAWDLGTAIGYPGRCQPVQWSHLPAGPGGRRPDARGHVRRTGPGQYRRAGH